MEHTHSLPEKCSTEKAEYKLNHFKDDINPNNDSEKCKYSINSEMEIKDYEERLSVSVTASETEVEEDIDIILNDIEIELIEEKSNGSNPSTFCEVYTKSRNSTKNHENVSEEEKPFKCTICPKSFVHEIQVKYHERIHKKKISKKKAKEISEKKAKEISKKMEGSKCDSKGSKNDSPKTDDIHDPTIGLSSETLNDKSTHSSTGLDSSKNHENVSEEEKPYKCKICPKSFICVIQLKYHERIHKKGLDKLETNVKEFVRKLV